MSDSQSLMHKLRSNMYNPRLGGVVGFLLSFPSLVLLINISDALFPKLDLGYFWMRSVFDQFGSFFTIVPLYMVILAVISGLVTSRWGLKVGIFSVLLINSASLLLN